MDRMKARMVSIQELGGDGLPEKAKIMQGRLREERERERLRKEAMQEVYTNPGKEENAESKERGVLEEVRKKKEENERRERGIIEKVWLGGEGPDWKAKRDQKEREALEEGRGYGGLIMDQIWEVWNWGKDKTEDLKEKDEEVVAERKEQKNDGTKK